ncbi:MAG: hypothetical protein JNJ83_05555 [Verrucomicrobiaceae bacterium]|nr:hypothetical protein [Verrucomicrobiaceae bacterium]
MLICLDSTIISGYLSNEVPGLVTGTLNLAGHTQPLRVELTGNFLRDIAGCRIEMLNPVPDANPQHIQALKAQQDGYVGQMTASYRVSHVPRARKASTGVFTPPAGLKNLIFLEWFNRDKQRVLIQSWHLHLTVSAPRWQLSKAAEMAQIRQNRERRKQFLLGGPGGTRLGGGVGDELDEGKAFNPFDGPPLNMAGLIEADPNEAKMEPNKDGLAASALINQVSAELAMELRRFEMLLASPGELKSRPAVLRLLSTAGDLAAHLSHVLKNFGSLKSSQWQYLITDLEQSLPLFHAALTACDKLVDQAAPGSDLRWLMNVQQTLCSVTGSVEQLMKWLRGV